MSSGRYDYIDALRGVAICGVLTIHVGLASPDIHFLLLKLSEYGAVGVKLFFIVSAMTFCYSMSGKEFDPRTFYIRRFFRIAPMFYIAGIVYPYVFSVNSNHNIWNDYNLYDYILTFTFLHGFFPEAINKVVPGGWSIACEMIFYAALPFLLHFITNMKRALIATFFSFLLAYSWRLSMRFFFDASEMMDNFILFGFLSNLPAFLCGISIYQFLKTSFAQGLALRLRRNFTAEVLVMGVLGLLIMVALSPYRHVQDPLVSIVVISIFVLATALSGTRLINNKLFRYLGVVSYSLYLVHFLFLMILLPIAQRLAISPDAGFVVGFILVSSFSVCVAGITYRYIEIPMIELGRRLTVRSRSVAVGG
ncbi:acyltransferase [Asticcacaulis sp. SL142]|uniref:acyltransferase family protein n=1 Tax=Asticcacaulis sp. SL142 TaxID=2995155 RepID=UPI00226C70DF|nr:acyltransferase [Asticcacaulis sp. SL142]WAC47967.1 acyltransferase [Asticcacaulis sp. SL142]